MTVSNGINLPVEDQGTIVRNLHSTVRTAWRTTMSEFAYGLSFREMSHVYGILHSVGEALLDASENLLRDKPGGDLLDAIQQDIASIRGEIGDYCISAAEYCNNDVAKADGTQGYCDSIALTEAAFDVEGNAELIAAIGSRLLAQRAAKVREGGFPSVTSPTI